MNQQEVKMANLVLRQMCWRVLETDQDTKWTRRQAELVEMLLDRVAPRQKGEAA